MSKKQADIRNWFNAGDSRELELENKEHCNDNDNEKPKTREILVFTDGSTLNNGSVNARGGVGVFFGNNDSRNISKKRRHTNCNSCFSSYRGNESIINYN